MGSDEEKKMEMKM